MVAVEGAATLMCRAQPKPCRKTKVVNGHRLKCALHEHLSFPRAVPRGVLCQAFYQIVRDLKGQNDEET